MSRNAKLLAAAPLLLAGCVSARATMLVPAGTYPPVEESRVQVFLEEDEVPGACTRVALIHAQGDADMTDESMMINAARRRAGKIGANAVLLSNFRDPSTGTRIASAVIGLSANRKGQMIAYRCPEGAAPVQPSATGR